MKRIALMTAVVAGMVAGAATACPQGNSFAEDVDMRGAIPNYASRPAIGPLAKALSSNDVISARNEFKGKTKMRGTVGGNATIVVIGPSAPRNVIGTIPNEMP